MRRRLLACGVPLPSRTIRGLAGVFSAPAALVGFIPSQRCSCPRATARLRSIEPTCRFLRRLRRSMCRGPAAATTHPLTMQNCGRPRASAAAPGFIPAGNPSRAFLRRGRGCLGLSPLSGVQPPVNVPGRRGCFSPVPPACGTASGSITLVGLRQCRCVWPATSEPPLGTLGLSDRSSAAGPSAYPAGAWPIRPNSRTSALYEVWHLPQRTEAEAFVH